MRRRGGQRRACGGWLRRCGLTFLCEQPAATLRQHDGALERRRCDPHGGGGGATSTDAGAVPWSAHDGNRCDAMRCGRSDSRTRFVASRGHSGSSRLRGQTDERKRLARYRSVVHDAVRAGSVARRMRGGSEQQQQQRRSQRAQRRRPCAGLETCKPAFGTTKRERLILTTADDKGKLYLLPLFMPGSFDEWLMRCRKSKKSSRLCGGAIGRQTKKTKKRKETLS